jgi:hypothetical protein
MQQPTYKRILYLQQEYKAKTFIGGHSRIGVPPNQIIGGGTCPLCPNGIDAYAAKIIILLRCT